MTATVIVARVYLRVSTAQQDLERQEQIVAAAKVKGFYNCPRHLALNADSVMVNFAGHY